MYYILHSGIISDPVWLKQKGFAAAGPVVCDGSLPSPAAILNAGLKAHINPYNDGNCGLNNSCNIPDPVSYFTQAKNLGYSMVFGEGVLAQYSNAGQDILPYGQYCGDIGGYQWDMTADNPRGRCSFGGQGLYVTPETYVEGNVINLGSAQTVIINAFNAGAKGVGFLIGSWPNVWLNGTDWVNFIRSFSADIQAKMAVIFWMGCGYDGVQKLKSGEWAEPVNTLMSNFPPSNVWGPQATAQPKPITPTPPPVNKVPWWSIIFG